jgi:hypothetical protein
MKDAAAGVHRGARQRGGVAARGAGGAEGDAGERRTIIKHCDVDQPGRKQWDRDPSLHGMEFSSAAECA